MGRYNATPRTLTDGQAVLEPEVDNKNNAKVVIADKLAGEDIPNDVMKTEQRFGYLYISTATTTTVKSGAGFLHRILITGGTTGVITIYDNTAASGTVIASFDAGLGNHEINCSFGTGLTIVTAAATKLTVVSR